MVLNRKGKLVSYPRVIVIALMMRGHRHILQGGEASPAGRAYLLRRLKALAPYSRSASGRNPTAITRSRLRMETDVPFRFSEATIWLSMLSDLG